MIKGMAKVFSEFSLNSEKSPFGLLSKRFFAASIAVLLITNLANAFYTQRSAAEYNENTKLNNFLKAGYANVREVLVSVMTTLFALLLAVPAVYSVGRNITDVHLVYNVLRPLAYAVLFAAILNNLIVFISKKGANVCLGYGDDDDCASRNPFEKVKDAVISTITDVSYAVTRGIGVWNEYGIFLGERQDDSVDAANDTYDSIFGNNSPDVTNGGGVGNNGYVGSLLALAFIFGLIQRAVAKAA